MTSRRAPQGQALIEFALVLPTLVVLLLTILQAGIVVLDDMRLHAVADASCRQAAALGGETSAVDDALTTLLRRNGLDPAQTTVAYDTDQGQGVEHGADAPGGAGGAGGAPPATGYGGSVTVRLTYTLAPLVPLPGVTAWVLRASSSEGSTGGVGTLPP